MMKLNRIALVASVLALGVAACGDDVQVVEPTPPVPPAPPPLTATMTPASATVAIGNSVVFAVGASGGAVGESASWTCSSSNTGIATASNTGAGCSATGVASGDVTIVAAVTKGGESTNAAASLTVTEEDTGEPAFIILASVKDNSDDNTTLSGKVNAVVNVERGDQTLEALYLLVDGEVVASQSFGGGMDMGMMPPEEDEAAEQAVHAFTLSFDSGGYDDDGTVHYMNGDHIISANLQIAGGMMADGMMGHETIHSNAATYEFDNEDAVHISVGGLGDGALNSSTGQVWYGGPDASIAISAIPVLYSGGSTTSVTLRSFCGAGALTDTEAPYEFAPDCGKHVSGEDGDTPTFNIAGDVVDKVVGAEALFLDFVGPGAPTFKPDPNGRDGGWLNAAVGLTSTSGKEAWLTKGTSDTGVGGYAAQLRYAAKPKSGSHAELALAADASTSLPAENKTALVYCVFASAVDRLGNESSLPEEGDATCEEPGRAAADADDPDTSDIDESVGVGYRELLRAAAADAATDADAAALANAGLLAGVDLTAPEVEFLAASLKDKATAIGASPLWGLHVADRIGVAHSDPIDVSIEVRDAKTTTKFASPRDDASAATADTFFVASTGTETMRHSITVLGDGDTGVRQGYYTFSATAMDAAGNESAEVSRVALHDGTPPNAPGLFLVPADEGYNSTIVLTEDLSLKSYATAVVAPDIGGAATVTAPELVASTGPVDAYNAASLTTSRTVQAPVNLPYVALQVDDAAPVAINTFKVYSTNQADVSANATTTVTLGDLPDAVEFRAGGANLTVTTLGATGSTAVTTFADDATTMRVSVTADMEDNVANLNAPFSVLGVYAVVSVGPSGSEVNQLRQVGIVPGAAAETELTDDGRNWEYEATLSLDAVWAAVEDTVDANADYANSLVVFGVAEDGLVVAEATAAITINNRD